MKAILTDIEGTTTKISFVKEVLFPYSVQKLPDFVMQHQENPTIKLLLSETKNYLHNHTLSTEQLIQQFLVWITEDQKITPLKTLQGMIWKQGYEKGELISHVYEDALLQLKHWHQQGLLLAIFSSGSVLAQKLLFSHTKEGDLTPLFSAYFDTTIGSKTSVEAYQHISQHLTIPTSDILFLSDVEAELNAAEKAGMHTIGLKREDNNNDIHNHKTVTHFLEIML